MSQRRGRSWRFWAAKWRTARRRRPVAQRRRFIRRCDRLDGVRNLSFMRLMGWTRALTMLATAISHGEGCLWLAKKRPDLVEMPHAWCMEFNSMTDSFPPIQIGKSQHALGQHRHSVGSLPRSCGGLLLEIQTEDRWATIPFHLVTEHNKQPTAKASPWQRHDKWRCAVAALVA